MLAQKYQIYFKIMFWQISFLVERERELEFCSPTLITGLSVNALCEKSR